MKMPTHIVIDTDDGWVFARDAYGHPFTEHTAKHFAAQRNDENRSYVVAAVVPLMSEELMTAVIKDGQETPPQLEAGSPEERPGEGRTVHLGDLFTDTEAATLPNMIASRSYYTPEEANEIRAKYGLEPRSWGKDDS